jgi:hypothetical protein
MLQMLLKQLEVCERFNERLWQFLTFDMFRGRQRGFFSYRVLVTALVRGLGHRGEV